MFNPEPASPSIDGHLSDAAAHLSLSGHTPPPTSRGTSPSLDRLSPTAQALLDARHAAHTTALATCLQACEGRLADAENTFARAVVQLVVARPSPARREAYAAYIVALDGLWRERVEGVEGAMEEHSRAVWDLEGGYDGDVARAASDDALEGGGGGGESQGSEPAGERGAVSDTGELRADSETRERVAPTEAGMDEDKV